LPPRRMEGGREGGESERKERGEREREREREEPHLPPVGRQGCRTGLFMSQFSLSLSLALSLSMLQLLLLASLAQP